MHFWWWWFLVLVHWSENSHTHTHKKQTKQKKKKKTMSIGWDLSVWWRVFSWMHIGGNWHGQCSVSSWTHSCVFGQFLMLEQVTTSLISDPYHQELSLDSLPWISLEKAHLPWAQVYALDNPSLKQPCPYLLTIIILLSPFGSNRDRISLWKALWISDTIAKANAKFSVIVSVNVL